MFLGIFFFAFAVSVLLAGSDNIRKATRNLPETAPSFPPPSTVIENSPLLDGVASSETEFCSIGKNFITNPVAGDPSAKDTFPFVGVRRGSLVDDLPHPVVMNAVVIIKVNEKRKIFIAVQLMLGSEN